MRSIEYSQRRLVRFSARTGAVLLMLAMAGFSPSLLLKSSAQDVEKNSGVMTSDAPAAVFAANAGTLGAIPDTNVTTPTCQNASTNFKDVTFTVSGLTGTVSTVAVDFNASHTYIQDLEVSLRGPGGAPNHLLFAATGTTSTAVGACGSFGFTALSSANTYTFADTASANWWTTVGAGTLVPTSTNRTVVTGIGGVPAPPPATTSLNSTFAGVSPNGTWTLRFRDQGVGDTGTVTAANLTITTVAGAGETIYTSNGSSISRFNSTALGTVTTVPVTGMQAGETLVDIDLRPLNGVLFGVGSASRLYSINPLTGAATQVGAAGAFTLNGTAFGTDFNPTVDRIRQVSNTEQNLRLNPNDGSLAATDTALNPAGNVVSVAYDRSDNDPTTATTLFGIDSAAGTLVMIGGVNGAPSPNGGVVTTVGSLGLGTNLNEAIGFDISTGGTAYASITTGGISRLYTINLTTGAATLSASNGGAIGAGTTPFVGLAVGTVPLASGVEVSGRVLSPEGRGIRGARVTMSDPSGATRTVMTGPNGAYRFEDVAGGQTYTMWVTARSFTFSPVVIQITDSLADLNFVGEGGGLIDR